MEHKISPVMKNRIFIVTYKRRNGGMTGSAAPYPRNELEALTLITFQAELIDSHTKRTGSARASHTDDY